MSYRKWKNVGLVMIKKLYSFRNLDGQEKIHCHFKITYFEEVFCGEVMDS